MKNVVAALNSSIQFNKKNFWIDPKTHNQYYVGVQYPEADIQSIDTLLDVPITSPLQKKAIPLRNVVASLDRVQVPAEVTHTTLQPTIDLTMGVHERDLGHVADDVYAVIARYGLPVQDTLFKWGVGVEDDPPRRLEAVRPHLVERRPAGREQDDAQRRIFPNAGHVREPRLRPDPGLAADLLPDGGPVQVVADAAGDPVGRAGRPGRRHYDAVPDRHGPQRAVAAGRDLHGGHRGVQHGAADRLRAEPAARRGRSARRRRSSGRRRSACGRW